MIGLIAGAIGVGKALLDRSNARVQGNRRRNMIYDAYNRGKERLDLTQGDVRQGTAESLVARGLAQGGDVNNGTAAAPGFAGERSQARTLGGAALSDLHHEQILEQNDLRTSRDNAIDDATAEQRQANVDAISGGISTAMNVYGAAKQLGAMRAPAPGASAPLVPGAGRGSADFNEQGVGTIRGAYGLDVLNPHPSQLGLGQSNAEFHR